MCSKRKFYICKHCGNIFGVIQDSGLLPICCGEEMTELVANTTDAATEKHVPMVTVEGNTVSATVGEVIHPMVENHFIQWIILVSEQGVQRKCLKPGDAPTVSFALTEGDKAVAVYEYCNLHGLWVKEC